MKELRKLSNEPLDGIKVVLNEDDVTDVSAEITGPGAGQAIRARGVYRENIRASSRDTRGPVNTHLTRKARVR